MPTWCLLEMIKVITAMAAVIEVMIAKPQKEIPLKVRKMLRLPMVVESQEVRRGLPLLPPPQLLLQATTVQISHQLQVRRRTQRIKPLHRVNYSIKTLVCVTEFNVIMFFA